MSAPGAAPAADQDSDGVPDSADVCIEAPNGPALPDTGGNSQLDVDGDAYGNLCDADFDQSGLVNLTDLQTFRAAFLTANPLADLDGNGFVNLLDLGIFRTRFFHPPGPSGRAPDGDGDGLSVAGGDCDDADPKVKPDSPITDPPEDPNPITQTDLGPGPCFDARAPNGSNPLATDGCRGLPANPLDLDLCPDARFAGSGGEVRACDLLNYCYSRCGADRGRCDEQFARNLDLTCEFLPEGQQGCRLPCEQALAAYRTLTVFDNTNDFYFERQRNSCTCCADPSACGDGLCDGTVGESPRNCAADCPGSNPLFTCPVSGVPCPSGICTPEGICLECVQDADCPGGFCNFKAQCVPCGDGLCEGEKGESCHAASCQEDCGFCPDSHECDLDADCEPTSWCANVTALPLGCRPKGDPGEPCLDDRACSSGTCGGLPPGPPSVALPGACVGSCGDDFCTLVPDGETCHASSCQEDCGRCANGVPCTVDADCASNRCVGLVCASCRARGAVCALDGQCCSGSCGFPSFTCD